jgi:DNA/RNA endonuclease G (NUC1)
MMSTFYLSNIAPQVGKGFNRDAWNKLEMYTRRLTRDYDHVYVCSGGWWAQKLAWCIGRARSIFLVATWPQRQPNPHSWFRP